MATRNERLSEFVTDCDPPPELSVELLCEDHVGTYVVPFPCRRQNGAWLNGATGEPIEAHVVGWRERRHSEKKLPRAEGAGLARGG
jgi:hypothetical protein